MDSARHLIKNTQIGAGAEEEESKKIKIHIFVGLLCEQNNVYSPFD